MATYTYTDAHDSAGRPEVRRPPHSGSIEATARFADNRAKATIGFAFNGTRKYFFWCDREHAHRSSRRGDRPGDAVL